MPGWPAASLLGRLPEDTRDDLLKLGTEVTYRPNQWIIWQGDTGKYVVLLRRGLVKVNATTKDGHNALLAVRVGGDLVGEMAAIDRQPRSANVIACVETQANIISELTFSSFIKRHSDAFLQVTRMISERLRWANQRRVEFASYRAPIRVARALVEIAQTYGRRTARGWELGVSLTHTELASLVGAALPTVERALRELKRDGVVERSQRSIVVTDMAALRNVAEIAEENPY